jgi:hypothetical protein
MRMGVTDGNDGVSAIEVQILLTFIVPYLTTLALHDVDVEKGIDIE